MKLSLVTIVASLFLPAVTSAEGAQGFLRQGGAAAASLADGDTYTPCLQESDLTFKLEIVENATAFERCISEVKSYFLDKLTERGCKTKFFSKELAYWYDSGSEEMSEFKYLSKQCEEARLAQELMADTFTDVIAGAPRPLDLKEFYDGRTYLNEEVGNLTTVNGQDGDGKFIGDYYANKAQSTLLEFPDEMLAFKSCDTTAAMCCWVSDRHAENNRNDGNCRPEADGSYNSNRGGNCFNKDPADNTDVCFVDVGKSKFHSHVAGGKAVFHDNKAAPDNDNTEGRAHCHGFAWKDSNESPSKRYRGNNLFYVSFYDHLRQRGYVRNIPGAPMCSCLDRAAVVTQSDCTEMAVTETYSFDYIAATSKTNVTISAVNIAYNACTGLDEDNDLESYYERLIDDGEIEDKKGTQIPTFRQAIVGDNNCSAAVDAFMLGHGWIRDPNQQQQSA